MKGWILCHCWPLIILLFLFEFTTFDPCWITYAMENYILVMLDVKNGQENARSRPVMLADRSHWNVVPFGMVYLLQLEFQGYHIWLCVREVNRLLNDKLLLCTLCRHGGISAPQQKYLSKSVGVNRAIFHDLVCTMWYSFRMSLMRIVPLQLMMHDFSFSIFRWDMA